MSRFFIGMTGPDPRKKIAFADFVASVRRTHGTVETIFDAETTLIAAIGMACSRAPNDHGVILGDIFSNPGVGLLDLVDHGNGREKSLASTLINGFWGGYVAILASTPNEIRVVRAPFGDLPCYYIEHRGALYFGSDTRLLLRATGIKPTIDWAALTRQLVFADLRASEGCISGVQELPGGDSLTAAVGRIQRETLWSPWTWTARESAIEDAAIAASELHRVAEFCIASRAKAHPRILLKLSGGLDSSIVAACLSRAEQDYRCITLATDDPSGDERQYARLVAEHLGVELIEKRRDPTEIDLTISAARGLPRPSTPGFRQESDRLCAETASETDALIVFDGGGGDNVFCALQSARAAADCLLNLRSLPRFAATSRNVADIAHVSTVKVMHAAIARAFHRAAPYRWSLDRQFISDQALADVPSRPFHPWLEPKTGILPGRAAHVGLLVAAQSYVEGLDPAQDPRLIAPLLSQPLVELCLRIPSWIWFSNGFNRAIARQAFAHDLPRAVTMRRSKGSPDAFVAQLFERNRDLIREHLKDGTLVDHGVLDPTTLASVLDSPEPPRDIQLQRLMKLFDAETWCRSWSA